MKIIRKNSSGGIIEEIEVSNMEIIKDAVIIKEPKIEREIVRVKDVEIVLEKYPVKVPVFEEKKIFVDKLEIIKKPLIIDIPQTRELESRIDEINSMAGSIKEELSKELKNIYEYLIKLKSEIKTITLYDFIYEKKKILVPEEYPFEYPKLIPIDTPVPELRKVDTPIPHIVFKDIIVDRAVINKKEVDTCLINHLCPHCGKKSVPFKEK